MILTSADYAVIAAYFALTLGLGLAVARRAGQGVESYFLSGRALPWWLAGTSMVATTFAADTPLAVSGIVARHGLAGNWLWWSFLMSGMLTTFLYARLWRRAGVLTDAELAEVRYSGRPAAFLRGFRAVYLALPINCIIMGWVTLAMVKILGVAFGVGEIEAVVLCLGVTLLYVTLSGLWGVVLTDFFHFTLAMVASIALAVFAWQAVEGLEGLRGGLAEIGRSAEETLAFFPSSGSPWMPLGTLLVYLAVNWWAAWYPGAEPGGGGYVAQRIFSSRDERHSLLGTLWFNVAHYAVRPWPWLLVALASLVLFPGLDDPETGYVRAMVELLPPVWRGLMLAAFAAAYMSTISTHLNWGASYLVGDLYRRFLVRGRSEAHYVRAARAATVLLMILAGLTTLGLSSIEGAWRFLLAVGAGTGPVYLLRWYWWRINAWSEIVAMAASFVISLGLQLGGGLEAADPRDFVWLMLLTLAGSSACWLAITYLTSPVDQETLRKFQQRVRPGGPGWEPLEDDSEEGKSRWESLMGLRDWALGCVLVYLTLFGVGKMLLGRPGQGALLLAAALAAGMVMSYDLRRLSPQTT